MFLTQISLEAFVYVACYVYEQRGGFCVSEDPDATRGHSREGLEFRGAFMKEELCYDPNI